MIRTIDCDILSEKIQAGDYFRPEEPTFILVKKGKIVISVNDATFECGLGNFILVTRMHLYKLVSHSDDVVFQAISIQNQNFFDGILNKINIYDLFLILNDSICFTIENNEVNRIISLTEQYFFFLQKSKTIFQSEITKNLLNTIIFLFLEIIFQQNSKANISSRKEEVALQFLKLSREHYKKEKNLSFYADKIFISEKYLFVCVKEITHRSPSEILAVWTMSYAKMQLITTKKSISEISSELYFSDQYAFGKFFKKHSGVSPRTFRNEQHHFSTI